MWGELLQIIQGTSVVLLIVTKAHQHAPGSVLKHDSLVLFFAADFISFATEM